MKASTGRPVISVSARQDAHGGRDGRQRAGQVASQQARRKRRAGEGGDANDSEQGC